MKDILESLPALAANWHALGLSATGPLEEMYALVQERAALAAETLRLAAVRREREGQDTPASGQPQEQRRRGRTDDSMGSSGIVLPPLDGILPTAPRDGAALHRTAPTGRESTWRWW